MERQHAHIEQADERHAVPSLDTPVLHVTWRHPDDGAPHPERRGIKDTLTPTDRVKVALHAEANALVPLTKQ
jgi:hypothetical protein